MMAKSVVLLSIPGLREKDVAVMPSLKRLMAGGEIAEFVPSFPCVTCPVQANMITGRLPSEHGVVANGFYWRDEGKIEMWTSPNECIASPQLWDLLSHTGGLRSAVWFPLHSKGAEADYVCTPAPVHNPDGTESLWCHTRPTELYGELRDEMGHFPLSHFWGPLADIEATAWIIGSAIHAARRWRPDFFYIYLPHLDYAAQRTGPDSPAAEKAVAELDTVIGALADGFAEAYGDTRVLWVAAGEYAIVPVNHVVYPNRVLRETGLLKIGDGEDGEHLDPRGSLAWALADHQFSHVFVRDHDQQVLRRVGDLFRGLPGIAEVLVEDQLSRYGLNHERSGDVVLISDPASWQAYYYWMTDENAPSFARTVDIHRKPGYDPAELFFEPATKGIPLNAGLVQGSHGAPALDPAQRSVIVATEPGLFPANSVADTEVFGIVLKHFGMEADHGS